MTPGVQQAVDSLRKAFEGVDILVDEDGAGGAYVVVSSVCIGSLYTPMHTWMGAHLSAQLPYADIYPVFIGAEVNRVDGKPHIAPVTPGHTFRGRPALQVSRRTNRLDPAIQTAAIKFEKVIYWLENNK